MNLLSEVQNMASARKVPEIKPGYTVKVHQIIKEGEKERVQIFQGLVIKLNSGHGADKSFTVRKIVEGIGVEKNFPLYSPLLKKIEVVKTGEVRRAKLYYIRDKSGKSARLKEEFVGLKDEKPLEPELMEQIVEAPVEETKKETAEETKAE